jgi:glycolate oxidase iron-sulfur subunit
MKKYPELFADDRQLLQEAKTFADRLLEFSTFFLTRLDNLSFKKMNEDTRVFYHDPCHLRFGPQKIMAEPRRLLAAATGKEPLELPQGPRCCGHGGLFSLAHPDLSKQIMDKLLDDLKELYPIHVVTTCSGCLLQLNEALTEAGIEAQVKHISQFLNELLEESPSNGIMADN